MTLPRNQNTEIASIKRDHTLYLNAFSGLTYLNPDDVLQGRGQGQYQAYEDLKKDGHAYSVLQKRYLAVVSREWKVEPASGARADKKAADMVKYHLTHLAARAEDEDVVAVGFDGLCYNLLDAVLKGYKPAEIIWNEDGNEIFPSQVKTRNQQRFPFGVNEKTGRWEMRLLTPENLMGGEAVQQLYPRKFFVHSFGANDDNPYGAGVGRTIWWNVFFKKQDIKFWLQFVDKFASPTAIGTYPRGATQEQKNTLLAALNAIATDAGVAVPEGLSITLLEAARSGSISTYKELASYMDSEISKAVLGETLSTEMGHTGSYAAAQTHDKVGQRLAKADADLLSDTLNRTVVKWTVAYNLPNAKPPRVWRDFGEQEDLNHRSQRDKTLFDMGFRLKPEAVKEVYGDDYEPIQSQSEEVTPEQFLANSGADGIDVSDTTTVALDTTDLTERFYPSLSTSRSLPLMTDFAEPEKDGIDRYTEQLSKRTVPIIDSWVEKVRDALANSDNFAEAQQRIIELYPDLDTTSFAEVMGQALVASEAAGRWEVLEETEGEEEFEENSVDFYNPGQPRDARGRFGSGSSSQKKTLNLSELTQQYRKKLLDDFDDAAKKNTIIHNAKTYKQISDAEGENVANARLNSHADKVAVLFAKREYNKNQLELENIKSKKAEAKIRKQQEKAFKELHPYLTHLTLEQFQKYEPQDFETLLERYKQKKREDTKKLLEEKSKQLERTRQASEAKAAFSDAPDNIKKSIEKYGYPDIITPLDQNSAFYSPHSRGLHMNSEPAPSFASTYRHEHGHYLDHQIGSKGKVPSTQGFISSSTEGKKAFNKDATNLTSDKYEKALFIARKTSENLMDQLILHDTVGALSNNKMGFGHSTAYLSRPGNRESETFANIVSLVGSGNSGLKEAVKVIAPSTYKFVMDTLND